MKEMLESIAWRKTREEWGREMEVKPKLSMLIKRITNLDEWSDCAGLRQKADRRMTIKLRGRMATFQIETGRWHGVAREDRICKECGKGKVEDVEQCIWLLRCETWKTHREPLIATVQEHYEVDQDGLAAVILSLTCRNYKMLSFISLTCGMQDLTELLVQYL